MRVLLLHNRYRAEGGEERAVAAQADLLSRHGHRVEMLEADSAALDRRTAARGLLGGGLAPDRVIAAVRACGAEVVHAHNVHPSFGWRGLAAARAAGAATVLQLHNFRLFCAIAVAVRDGRPCHECRGIDTRPGLVHRCRGGLAESAVYAAGLSLQARRLIHHSDRLIALSHGHLDLLEAQGLPGGRVSVVGNFVADRNWAQASGAGAGRHALVAGRLVPEKGFDTAIRAAAQADVPLVVAGDGPDAARLRALAEELGAPVSFAGWLDRDALATAIRQAGVVLVPSRCEEAFGYGALDALAAGVPVIASPRGGLAELVGPIGGHLLDPDDPRAWGQALAELWRDPARRTREGDRGLIATRERYAETPTLESLLRAYGAAEERRRGSPPC